MNTSPLLRAKLLLILIGALSGCAQNPHPMDMTSAVQNVRTPAGYMALAEHCDQAADAADAQTKSHKQLLDGLSGQP